MASLETSLKANSDRQTDRQTEKATYRGLSYRSAQKGLDSIKFFFERVSRNYIIVLLNFYYCLILVEILPSSAKLQLQLQLAG